jgi:hypothetical protein
MLLRRRKQKDNGSIDATVRLLSSRVCLYSLSLPPPIAVKPGHPSSSNRDYAEYPHLYRGGVKHDADHGAERLGGEVLLELSANDTRVAWRTISDALFPNYTVRSCKKTYREAW